MLEDSAETSSPNRKRSAGLRFGVTGVECLPLGEGGAQRRMRGIMQRNLYFVRFRLLPLISQLRCQLLAAARSRRGSDMPPACHSLPRRRFAPSRGRLFWPPLEGGVPKGQGCRPRSNPAKRLRRGKAAPAELRGRPRPSSFSLFLLFDPLPCSPDEKRV